MIAGLATAAMEPRPTAKEPSSPAPSSAPPPTAPASDDTSAPTAPVNATIAGAAASAPQIIGGNAVATPFTAPPRPPSAVDKPTTILLVATDSFQNFLM